MYIVFLFVDLEIYLLLVSLFVGVLLPSLIDFILSNLISKGWSIELLIRNLLECTMLDRCRAVLVEDPC